MIKLNSKDRCCGCYACYNSCQKHCIEMETDEEGFWYPLVKQDQCINCGLCERACPVLHPQIGINKPLAYAAINNNEAIRYASSSGGVFSLIAEHVLNQGGAVYGAAFDETFDVCHQVVCSVDELAKLRGSKYVQSKIGNTYQSARDRLEQGTPVLFCGTPCQVNGLKSFLQKAYANLICMDFICHGVPSPLVWKKYVDIRCRSDGGTIQRITFRLKDQSWKLFAISFDYLNETAYRKDFTQDMFMRGFLSDLYLRPSCYNCSFKTENRVSDFTLADFWGIEKILPEMDDDRGTSLVVIHSEKGERIFRAINDRIRYKKVNLAEVLNYNRSMVTSVPINKKRKKFFNELHKCDNIECLIDEHSTPGLIRSWLRLMKRMVKKAVGRRA